MWLLQFINLTVNSGAVNFLEWVSGHTKALVFVACNLDCNSWSHRTALVPFTDDGNDTRKGRDVSQSPSSWARTGTWDDYLLMHIVWTGPRFKKQSNLETQQSLTQHTWTLSCPYQLSLGYDETDDQARERQLIIGAIILNTNAPGRKLVQVLSYISPKNNVRCVSLTKIDFNSAYFRARPWARRFSHILSHLTSWIKNRSPHIHKDSKSIISKRVSKL